MDIVAEATKHCRRCNQDLPVANFDYRADRSKGLRAWCRQCESPDALKYCKHCETRKPLAEFHLRKDAKGATHKGWCKSCQQGYLRAWRFNKHYGITLEDYQRMWIAQLGLCAICWREPEGRDLVVDHDHATGKVRGLLCDRCNTGMGQFEDNMAWLLRAASYAAGLVQPFTAKDYVG